ncbi:terpene synthase family protein [Archangium primigenium]|uniref:terpene synthase family protein n=1 Tax=[Archangium] primigenium TaxID=2792470 RepID=UPI0019585515|nr:hypothetical protein [Archangium primigenium]MBM7114442.1 hypothetical protein [Archangium primigenium]
MNPQLIYQALETVPWGDAPPINTHYPGICHETDGWLDRVGQTDKPGRRERHQRIAVPLFAAMAYPTAARDHLLLAHDWMAWLFEYDDQFDDGADGHSTHKARRSRESLLAILSDPLGTTREVPGRTLQSGLQDIWSRLRAVTRPRMQARFAGHVSDYLESYEWETHNRRIGYCPDVEEYLEKRQHTGAAHPCFDLIVPAAGVRCDHLDLTDSRLRRLEYLSSEIITLSNDLVSFPKEMEQGDVHNIVIILMNRRGHSEQEAIRQTVDWIKSRLEEFERSARELGRDPRASNEDTRLYLHGLKVWYLANYFWSLRCSRFVVDGGGSRETPERAAGG